MKKFLPIILIALLSASLFAGCKTTTNPTGVITVGTVTLDPKAVGTTVRITAKLGAIATINAEPTSREYFALAGNVISAAIASGDYNPTNLNLSINSMTGNTLVSSSIADALNLYQVFFGQVITNNLSNNSLYTVPVLQGLADGIYDAYTATAPRMGVRLHYTPVAPTKLK